MNGTHTLRTPDRTVKRNVLYSDLDQNVQQCDILIAGGGAVGLTLAIALKQFEPTFRIIIVDAAPQKKKPSHDIRALSLASASICMLKQLQCWEQIEPHTQPIHSIIITDARVDDLIKSTFLTFEEDASSKDPFAFIIENEAFICTLKTRAQDLNIPYIDDVRVIDFHQDNRYATVALSNNDIWKTKLLVAADGARSKLRERAGLKVFSHPYKQTAITCTINHEHPHHGQAIQHFFPTGPFACLPLKGNRSAIVWSEHDQTALEYLKAPHIILKTEIEKRVGRKFGKLTWNGKYRTFPLTLSLAHHYIKPRFALVGDSAHTIHPLAGQGLNLGLRDCAALAEVIIETARLGLDIGSLSTLETYQRWRRFEIVRMALSNDLLNRLFSNDLFLFRMLRDIGLGIVNQMPQMKKYLIREASGLTKNAPRLLRGLPL